MAAAASSLCGTSRWIIVFSDVPASDPEAKLLAIAVTAPLNSSNDTPAVAAAAPPCASAIW